MNYLAIYPSLMGAPLMQLGREIKKLESYCAGFHIDVMDYHFVPNLMGGIGYVNQISTYTKKPLWIHLMMEKSLNFAQSILIRPHDIVSFHIEEQADHLLLIKYIREKKSRASIAIKPKTPLEQIFDFLPIVDQVLVMSVEPGFSGQHFLHESFEKITALVSYKKEHDLNFSIGCDGGITDNIVNLLMRCGVDEVALASAIFNAEDSLDNLKRIYRNLSVV